MKNPFIYMYPSKPRFRYPLINLVPQVIHPNSYPVYEILPSFLTPNLVFHPMPCHRPPKNTYLTALPLFTHLIGFVPPSFPFLSQEISNGGYIYI